MVAQDLEDALGIITDDEEDRKGADRRVILVQAIRSETAVTMDGWGGVGMSLRMVLMGGYGW